MAEHVLLDKPGVELNPGDHICAFYSTLAERDEIVIPYLSEGIAAGDKCIAIVDSGGPDRILAELGSRVDLDSCRHHRQLDLHVAADSYTKGGRFSTKAMLDFWDTLVGGAVADGYPFVRAVGEMTWALRQVPGVEELIGYEAQLNRFLPRYPQVILCMYALNDFSARVLVDALMVHPKMLVSGMVLDNPYYLEPDEFLSLKHR